MKNDNTKKLFERLEEIRKEVEGVEFWSARDLQEIFNYKEWRNFEKVIQKAAISVKNTSYSVESHFVESNKLYEVNNGATREKKDYALTRYACYLVAQNGDPNKEEIAFAQSYFAIQTRKQELIEKRFLEAGRVKERDRLTENEKVLSELIAQRNADFGYIRAMGDKALFGGLSTKEVKNKLEVPQNRALSDFLQTSLIAGKNFATTITNENIRNRNLEGTDSIANEHFDNNDEVRQLLIRRGVYPEDLPADEDVKKIKRRIGSEVKKLNAKKKGGKSE